MKTQFTILLLAAGLASGSARADQPDRPATRPQRDVDVTYSMVPNGADDNALRQRARWDVADQRMRVDLPSPGTWMLVDFRARRMQMVSDHDRQVVQLGDRAARLPGETPEGDFTRQGDDKVAGVGCTEWSTVDSAGKAVTVCITGDGVLLRARSGPHLLIEATQIDYRHQDATVFTVPDGYAEVTPTPVTTPPPVPSAPPAPAATPTP